MAIGTGANKPSPWALPLRVSGEIDRVHPEQARAHSAIAAPMTFTGKGTW